WIGSEGSDGAGGDGLLFVLKRTADDYGPGVRGNRFGVLGERKKWHAGFGFGSNNGEISVLSGCNHAGHVANFSIGRFGDAIRRVRNHCPTRDQQSVARNKESVASPQELTIE